MSCSNVEIKRDFNRSAIRYPYTVFDIEKPQFHRRIMERMNRVLGIPRGNKTATILDVGCGTAYFTSLLPIGYSRVVGMDISENMVKIAKITLEYVDKNGNIDLIIADGEHTPFRFDVFQEVFCLDVLHHVDNLESIFREMLRVVVCGGKVMALEPNFSNPFYPILCFITRQEALPKFIKASKQNLKKMYIANKLKEISITEIDFIPQVFFKLTPFPEWLSYVLEFVESLFRNHPTFYFLSSHFAISGNKG
ncbi:methylase involved in ubiquinone/menaquinone biosynthesis [Thaumarchaeota archaeon SCGC AB-539-E09]|nr:methylase involved in ubiquinone/menaquinone biosynthesis [Thaumarchaeota archaeon SCGC AB-539-E09]